MLDLSAQIKSIYESDVYTGNFKFTIGAEEFDSTHMKGGTLEITESLCSTDSITFSATEKGELKVTLGNLNHTIDELKGKTLTAVQIVNETEIPLGVFTIVDSQNKTTNFIDIQAFDNLHKLDIDVSDWWNNTVTFPISIKNLLISLFTYCGVTYNLPETFTNSTYMINQNMYFEGVSGLEILSYIQEIIACFVKPDRYGVMRLVTLPTLDWNLVTPSYTYSVGKTIQGLTIADFETEWITKVQVRGSADDIGVIVGTGSNTFVIESNALLSYITDTTTDREMIQNILSVVSKIKYRPFSGTFKGLPFIECGDMVQVLTATNMTAWGLLLKRTLYGSGIRRDKIDTKGVEKQEQVKRVNRTVQVLKAQTHEISNTVSELTSTITEVETDLSGAITEYQTLIEQNSQEIQLKANTSDVQNQFNELDKAITDETNERTSAITVASDEIKSEVESTYQTKEDMENYSNTATVKSLISQLAESITLAVTNSEGRDTSITITVKDADGNETESSGTIILSGDVVFQSDLSTAGATRIAGGNIIAESITTNLLEVDASNAITGVNSNITFDSSGMRIRTKKEDDTTDTADYNTLFSNDGMRVMDSENNVTLSAVGNTVEAANFTAQTYLRILGALATARFQTYHDNVDNEDMFGCFWEKKNT